MKKLTQKTLKKILYYNPLTGIFTWRERNVSMFNHCKNPRRQCDIWNTRFANKEAGRKYKLRKESKTSYVVICITLNGESKKYLAHRLVFLYTDGRFPPEQVDHIDGNGLNNRESNLRKVDALENHKNYPMRSDNKSGCVGVRWNKAAQKWRAYIYVNGKYIHGGSFADKVDATAKRKKMEIEYNFHKNHGREGVK